MTVPQNMPGGGSFIAAKFMYEAASTRVHDAAAAALKVRESVVHTSE